MAQTVGTQANLSNTDGKCKEFNRKSVAAPRGFAFVSLVAPPSDWQWLGMGAEAAGKGRAAETNNQNGKHTNNETEQQTSKTTNKRTKTTTNKYKCNTKQ